MTYRDALREASTLLREVSESPWLDATVLMAHITGNSRETVLASFPDELAAGTYAAFIETIRLRREGHPVAYLTGKKEFFGRDFFVQEGILCPRPETEILVEEALALIRSRGYRKVHDVCTGSGCIALTLALEEKNLTLSASDISPRGEEIFQKNKMNLAMEKDKGDLSVPFIKTSLLEGLTGPYDMIVSNPPYLTTEETRERMGEGWKEPALALDGGWDGLDLIRQLIPSSYRLLEEGGCLIIEAASPQMKSMESLMAETGFEGIRILQDLAYRDRVIIGTKKS